FVAELEVPDGVHETLVTGFPARIPVVDSTHVFHVPDPAEERIQNGRNVCTGLMSDTASRELI
ncbi:MAG: hypothetical protein L0Z49_07250, partial [Actinobacteria bacterium]|nr:hypothetical protein [Actinomycetota bacterium]